MEHLGLIFQTLKNCKQSSNKVVLFLFIITSLAVLVCTDEDYYKLLGLTKSATNRQIRQAFKKLALTMHPDKNPVSRIVLIRIFKCSLIDILCWMNEMRTSYSSASKENVVYCRMRFPQIVSEQILYF